MKHSSFSLSVFARLLCVAVVLGMLAGCSAAASPSSSVEAAVTPSQAEVQPTEAPSDSTNNIALPPLSLPNEALDLCLGWGPGTAGSTLHSISAAAALLDWATENELSARSYDEIVECLHNWYSSLSSFDQETFEETWPLVCDDANALLTDPTALSGTLESAGLSVASVAYASEDDWNTLLNVLDSAVSSAA
jgi:hypothetical protein